MSEYIPVFESKEKVDAFLANLEKKSKLALFDWRRVFSVPMAQLNSIMNTALIGLGVDLQACWEEIECVEGGKVRRVGINWGIDGKTREIAVTDSRRSDETTRLEIRIRYPDRSGERPVYGWEVYTLSLDFYASERILFLNNSGVLEMEVRDVPRKPVLDLQVSEVPSQRLGFGNKTGGYVFKNPILAKKIFIQGVEQVCNALKEPDIVLIP